MCDVKKCSMKENVFMERKKKVIIIGAVAAGSKCAFKLKRELNDCNVVIYTEEDVVSYSACGLPFFIGGQIKSSENLIIRKPEDYLKAGIDLRLKHRLCSIDSNKKIISVLDIESNKIFEDDFDELVLATGAKPIVPLIKNVDLKNIFTLRHVQDGVSIKEQMLKSKTAAIIGAGYIGIELLEAFVRNGLNVKLIEGSSQIINVFDKDISDIIEKHIMDVSSDKVEIIKSAVAQEFVGENGVVKKIKLSNGQEVDVDMVVLCVGVKPTTEYVVGSGVELGLKGTIKVNEYLQTNIPNIWAIGDCAEKTHLVSQKPCWIPLGSTANKEGRACAINIAGQKEPFIGVLGSAVTRYNGFTMSKTGLNEKEAIENGFDVVSEMITKKDRAGYMPEVKNITIKVLADKKTKKLLGAQAIGCGDADKRVNTVTGAIMSGKSVSDLVNLDMTYAPPFSPSIDPLLTALFNIDKKLNEN